MKSNTYLSKKQKAFLEDLLGGQYELSGLLERHRIRPGVYRRWLNNAIFVAELNERLESSRQQSRMLLTRFAPAAAAKLVELTGSDKGETGRKACLDVLKLSGQKKDAETSQEQEAGVEMSDEQVGKILRIMAGEEKS
jgi:hypothetical protein